MRFKVLLTTVLISAAAGYAAQPAISVGANVTIKGVTPGATFVLFGASRDVGQTNTIAVRVFREVVRDEDRDGIISFLPKEGIAPRSIWIAVDVASGDFWPAAPDGFALSPRQFAMTALKRDVDRDIAALEAERPRLFYVLIRPGKGAWTDLLFEGGKRDGDRLSNGKLLISFGDAEPLIGSEKAPKKLRKGDVLLAIDPGRLDFFSVRIEQ